MGRTIFKIIVAVFGAVTMMPWKMQAQDTPKMEFTGHKGCVYDIAVSPDGKWLASVGKDNTARIWDLASGKMVKSFTGNGTELYTVAFDEKGQKVFAGGLGGGILCADINSGNLAYKRNYYEKPVVRGITTGYNDVAFCSADRDAVTVHYRNANTPPKTIPLSDLGIYNVIAMRNIGKTSNVVLCYTGGSAMLDVSTGKLTKLPGSILSFACGASADGKLVFGGMRTIISYEAATGRRQGNFEDIDPEASASNFFCADMGPGNEYLLGGYDSGEVIIWEARSKLLIARYFAHDNFGCAGSAEKEIDNRFLGEKSGLSAIRFLPDGRRFVTCGNSGAIKMWDIRALIPAQYKPENLKKALQVTITEPDGFQPGKTLTNTDKYWLKIQGTVQNNVGPVTVSVNGESVYVDPAKGNNFKIALSPKDGLNTVVVEASDKRETVKQTILVQQASEDERTATAKPYIPEPKEPKPSKTDQDLDPTRFTVPNLYAVIVGVSEYKHHPELALKYAAKDAKAYYDFLICEQGGAVPKGNIAFLTDAQATRANILAQVDEILDKAQRDDVFIFYYSGHGKVYGNYDELCFLAYDSETTEKFKMGNTSVRQSDLVRGLKSSNVRKKILFIDACHSGIFAYNGEKDGGNINSTLLKQMAKTLEATAIFTSSANNQSSYEDETLDGGHGIFSYYMLKGLEGKADTEYPGNGNGFVTVNELHRYVNDQVSKRAILIGKQQNPELANRSSLDFPLSAVNTQHKKKRK